MLQAIQWQLWKSAIFSSQATILVKKVNGHEGSRMHYEFHNWQTVTSIAKDHRDLKMPVTIYQSRTNYQSTQHNKPNDMNIWKQYLDKLNEAIVSYNSPLFSISLLK